MSTAEVTENVDGWIPEDTFGARCALVRQMKGWNVSDAAESCGISASTWTGWEAGSMPRNLEQAARKISIGSGASFRYLMLGGELSTKPELAPVNGCDQLLLLDGASQPVDFGFQITPLTPLGDFAAWRARKAS